MSDTVTCDNVADILTDNFPVNGDVTVQVVERRTTVLDDDEYLESVITSPDPLAKAMIPAYIMTEKSEQLF